jgi:branched-chain amino acid transport system substrate-binding protein
MVTVVAACGSSSSSGSSSGGSSSGGTSSSSGGATSSTSSSGGSSSGASALPSSVTVGALLPLSGPAAYFGQLVVKGPALAVDKINSAGGLDGKTKFTFKAADNQGTTTGQVSALTNLISTESNLKMVLGYGAASNVAIKSYLSQHDLVGFNAGSPASALSDLLPTWFNLYVLDPIELRALSDYLIDVKHLKTAAVLGQDDAGGNGQDWASAFSKAFVAAGGKIVGSEMASDTATTFQSQVSDLKAKNPQVVFLATLSGPNVTMAKEMDEVGWHPQLASDSHIVGFADLYDSPAAQGLIHTGYEFNPSTSFLAMWKKVAGAKAGPPTNYAGNYYDAVMIYADGLKYAAAHGMGTSGTAVAQAIHKIGTFQSVYGHPLTIESDGDAIRAVSVYEIDNHQDKLLQANANHYKP